ncbi:hypothetical protein EXIGLDRAFT_683045 [Exidia glandulosa HHB12029]|uniref:Amidohydrolase-related domain-containing protein n=1 Tax=Exidia glandulosa HHB12029 TaxID=1314781 RepID=A0A165DCD3_EXIGL|nr:hypothetical protein EXIGLDRAFT_683045 [Exidia glandulosa HHB12029]
MPMQLIDANSGDGASTETTRIVTSRLFDPYTLEFLEDRLITVHTASGVILRVSRVSKDFQASTHDIDLRGLTVLPGFVDSHVHFFLHPYSETSWDDQVLKENLVERTVRAVNHARETLLAGYTAVRDLGTEGAEDADTPLRACISKPKNLTVGPRYFIANRAIVSTGGYGPKGNINLNRQGVDDRLGAEAADGIEECRKAVRRQIGAGADWIKIYAEYRTKTRNLTSEESLDSYPLFSREELKVMIDTAHSGGVRVAAHVVNEESIITLADLGIDTIEHGQLISDRGLAVLNRTKTIWTPTLMAFESHPNGSIAREPAKRAFQAALESAVRGDIRISVGGDTGVFSHGKNADEMKVMVRYGAPWKHVLRWATLGGWEAVRPMRWEGSRGSELLQARDVMSDEEVVAAAETTSDNSIPFGVIRRGWAADIIALEGDLEKDFAAAVSPDSVRFVMKAGVVYKQDGRPTFF